MLTFPARVIAINHDPPIVCLQFIGLDTRRHEMSFPVQAITDEWELGREFEIEVREKAKG